MKQTLVGLMAAFDVLFLFVPEAEAKLSGERVFEVGARWLMIPVRNGEKKDTRVEVFAENRMAEGFSMGVAAADPDWYAVYDVSPWKGRQITLRIYDDDRAEDVLKLCRLADDAPAPDGYDGERRPQFHFSPCRGWMNDPNGLSYYKGEWHLFFQHNPYGTGWGNMHWGHAVSKDLLHWREVGEALCPDRLGDMFSGSAVIDAGNAAGFGEDAHVLVFTGTANDMTQSIAWSRDGRKYEKWTGNPVLPNITGGNRDPRVFWHRPTKSWVMVLYLKEEEEHHVGIFASKDLKSWTRTGTVRGDVCGKGPYLFECPELFELPVEGEKTTRWILFGANAEYAVGTFDGRAFTPEEERIPMFAGMGGYYASQTFGNVPDRRRILLPWFRIQAPGMPFDQAAGLPRELRLKRFPEGLRVLQFPVRELERLREGTSVPFGAFEGELVEAIVDVRPAPSAHLVWSFRGVEISYDAARGILGTPCGSMGWPLQAGRLQARIFIDRTGMEIFSSDGLICLPIDRALPETGNRRLALVKGAERTYDDRSRAYRLRSIWR